MPTATRSRTHARAAAVLAAVLAALAVWIIIDPLAGVDLTVRVDDKLQTVGLTSPSGTPSW